MNICKCYTALFTAPFQQLYRDNSKIIQPRLFPEENSFTVQNKSVQ